MGGYPWVLNVENKTSPNEDRYTWRHNNVLRLLCNAIIHKVQQCNADNHKNNISGIQFVKEKASATTINTAKMQNKRKTFYGDLAGANDWTVFFELPELKAFSIKHFPQVICQILYTEMHCCRSWLSRIYPTFFQKSTSTIWIHLNGIEKTY